MSLLLMPVVNVFFGASVVIRDSGPPFTVSCITNENHRFFRMSAKTPYKVTMDGNNSGAPKFEPV
jgi:hypothetical protein